VCLAAAAVVSLAPLAGQAAPARSLDTCIDAFVSQHLPSGHRIAQVRKVRPSRDAFDNFRSRFTYRVRANGVDTGEEIASATCVVSRKGELLAMRVEPSKVRFADARHPIRKDRSNG
jgi:hypothetical protein